MHWRWVVFRKDPVRNFVAMTTTKIVVYLLVVLTSLCWCSASATTTNSPPVSTTPPPFVVETQSSPAKSAPLLAEPGHCSLPQTPGLKFSVASYRNRTGHWIAQVRLEHENKPGVPGTDHHETGHWQIDVEQRKVQCAGVNTVQIITTVSEPPPRAAPGFEFFPGVGYYKFHKEGRTWDEARKVCQEEGGHLVIINSESESKVLQDLFSRAPKLENVNYNDYISVGFHDRYVEGEFLTIFGASLQSTGFTRWSSANQPDNAGGNENCGSMHRNGGLNDIPCTSKLAYVCEQELW